MNLEQTTRFHERLVKNCSRVPMSKWMTRLLVLSGTWSKRMVFVASTGRCGTASLSHILGGIQNACVCHEPFPSMNGNPMIQLNQGDSRAARKLYANRKILSIMLLSRGYEYYIETNHMFIKSFGEFILKDFSKRIGVIHLYRDPIGMANSLYSLRSIPGTPKSNKWTLDYHARKNIVQVADILDGDPHFQHDFFKCLWYWFEIEARVAEFKDMYKDVPCFDISTEDLNSETKIFEMLAHLKISYDEATLRTLIGTRANQKIKQKERSAIARAEAGEMYLRFEQMLREQGYRLPPIELR